MSHDHPFVSTFLGCTIAILLVMAPGHLRADETIVGPVSVDVVKVRDGDTVEIDAHVWPQQTVRVAVRLRGIDAPEMRAKCPLEKVAAVAARDRLVELVSGGEVAIRGVSGDKYFGRVLAEMSARGDDDIGATLLREGLVAAYGGKTRRDWCDGRQSLRPDVRGIPDRG